MTTTPVAVAQPGDTVICDGAEHQVLEVRVHGPGEHPHSPISDGHYAREVVTTAGSRWVGHAPGEAYRGAEIAARQPGGVRFEQQPGTARDSGITPANAWDDDPKYRPQQVIPAGLERPCGHNGCQGVIRPVPGTDHFDADGSAMIDANCDTCPIQSVAYWYWPAGDPPAEDPDHLADEDDDEEPSTTAASERHPQTDAGQHAGGVPEPTITGGTVTAPTGELRRIGTTRTYLEELAKANDDRQAQAEQAAASLEQLGLDSSTIAEAHLVKEDLGQIAGKARHTLTVLNTKHHLMEEAVAATPEHAERDYYRHQ